MAPLLRWADQCGADDLSGWMEELVPDCLPISAVSMPGTHNSASFALSRRRLPSLVVAGGRCQGWDFDAQLRAGVRFLDLRTRPCGALCHGPLDCGLTLQDAFQSCANFLREHPGEFLLARVKDEAAGAPTAHGVDALVRSLAQDYPLYLEQRLPLVGEVRGKIVVLCDWIGADLGVSWGGELMSIQDQYWHSSGRAKWRVVSQKLLRARVPSDSLQVHFTSSTSLPVRGPLSLARSVNRKLNAYLRTTPYHRFIGIMVMDFPSASLCELVVRRNRRGLDPCRPLHGITVVNAQVRDELADLQCALAAAATCLDAMALAPTQAPHEVLSRARWLAHLTVRLAEERVAAELLEPVVADPPLPSLSPEASCERLPPEAAPLPACKARSGAGGAIRPKTRTAGDIVARLGSGFFGRCAKA